MSLLLLAARDLRRQKVFRDRLEPLQRYDDTELRNLFRFERRSIVTLIDLIEERLTRRTRRNRSLNPSLQVCITLTYLGSASFQQILAAWAGIDQTTISRVYIVVVKAINSALHNIKFPTSLTDINECKTGFRAICKLDDVIGALDCTHVRILRPSSNRFPDEYINRKNFHSINVQGVCDASYKFLSVVAEWPGSVHDSRIFRNSDIFRYLLNNPENGYLVGDSGYRLYKFLMIPYANVNDQQEHKFNKELSRARVRIEITFGILKQRFNCLGRILRIPLDRVALVILVCCKLHNFGIANGDLWENSILVSSTESVNDVIPFDVEVSERQLQRQGAVLRDHLKTLIN